MARTTEDPRRKEVPQPFPEQHQEPPGRERDFGEGQERERDAGD